jgi:hypothetical protein
METSRTQLVIPAFSISASLWTGVSRLQAEFPLSNSRNLSLALPIPAWDPSFVAAVRYVETRGVATRFMLWVDPNAVVFYPLYNGQTLGPGAVIEIWNNSQTGAYCQLNQSVLLDTSWLNASTNCMSQCGPDPVVQISLAYVPPVNLPYNSYCNPFCFALSTPGTVPATPGFVCPTDVDGGVI